VAALPDGGALAGHDVSPDGKRLIHLVQMLPSGKVAVQQEVPGSEDGKYPQLTVLDSTTAVVGWTEVKGEGSRMRLARISLNARR
jgi:hypothetical protein